MHTFRRTWLALMGAILLVTLSVSAAFGAKPTDTEGPRGQSIAAFVHDLVFGSEETDDEVNEDEDVADDDEDGTDDDEDVVEDEDSDEEADELVDDDAQRQVPEEFANHGECVADATHDTEGFEASEAETFGAWVSMHARYECWGLEPPTDEADEDAAEEESEGDADEASAKEQRKAERAAARGERKAEREAAKAARFAAQLGGGHANGRGGGRH